MILSFYREGGEATVNIFYDKNLIRKYLNFLAKNELPDEDKRILQKSLLCLQNLGSSIKCRWKLIIDYLGCPKSDEWKCNSKCDVCLNTTNIDENEITNFALPVLKFLKDRKILRSHLLYILLGRPSELSKVPEYLREDATMEGLVGMYLCFLHRGRLPNYSMRHAPVYKIGLFLFFFPRSF